MQYIFKYSKAKLDYLFSHFHLCIKLCRLDYFQQTQDSSSGSNSVRESTVLYFDVLTLLREDLGHDDSPFHQSEQTL